jgi:hypothetical protein
MADDLGSDLDQLLAQCGQGPVLDLLRQYRLLLMMQWTAPIAGIAMCQSAVAVEERLESAVG